MQKTTTLTRLRLFFGKMFPLLILIAVSAVKMSAQPYVNGTLSTGTTTASGVTSPAGYTWSECQNPTGNTTVANTTAGFGAQVAANNSIADDFTVPGGVGWALTKITVYGYSTGYTGATTPYNDVRIRIHRGNPALGPTTIVFGDLTTNRFAASSDAQMYRLFNTVVTPATPPDQNRKIWKIEANVSVTLGPGVYWMEYQIGTAQASNFAPVSSPIGVRTLPGYNAIQSLAGGPFAALVDPGQGPAATPVPVDMPFTVDYSIVAAPPCTPITSAVLSAPNVLLTEGMDGTVPPAGWFAKNNSAPLGATGWTQGGPLGVFPSHSGAGFISANFNNTGTTGTISNWLLTPTLNMKNGDVFSFWTRTTTGDFPDRLQVRMSTSGGSTNVGTSATDVGDFSNLLLDINPSYTATGYPVSWTKFDVTISGLPAAGASGKMAFRYFVENAGLLGTNSDFIGIDDIAYSSSGAPTICSGGSGNIKVDITGGVGPYTVVYTATPPGTNVTVNNYNSGANIPVSPTANTTYTLVSVTGLDGCVSTNNSGTGVINVTTGSTSAVLSQVLLPPVPSTTINEGMDGTVPPAGWSFTNNSSPLGATNWTQGGPLGVFPPHSGAGFISANFNNVGTLGTISNWLFLPATPPTLRNGDVLKFWTRTTTGQFPDRLQVRMNTANGGTNVGATATSVGDFTTLLLDINPTYTATGYPTAWTEFTITLSGLPAGGATGRLAFRYFVENAGLLGVNSDFIGIDDVSYVTTIPGGPPTTCTGSTANLQVNITGGTSPYTVTITPTSPAGPPIVVTNYVSGTPIPVTPAVTTTYALTSVVSSIGCVGTGNSGTPTITVSPTTIPPLSIIDDPTGPLCAGNPKLLTAINGPTFTTFTSAGTVQIPAAPTTSGIANPYPSNLVVSGLPTSGVTVKSVAINGFTHTFPVDVDILLQSPTGQNVVIMSDVGGTGSISNVNYVFDDAAATAMTAAAAPAGTYKPSNVTTPDTWVAPGPGAITQATPTLSTFTGDFNGTWKLFAVDDVGGDAGTISGWNIIFAAPSAPPVGYTYVWSPAAGLSSTTSNPVAASPMQTTTYQVLATAPSGCQTTAQITINVNQLPSVTTPPANTSVCAGSTATFTAVGSGAGATYQWQVSTTGAGGPWTNVVNGAPYSGATTNTLTINPVTNAMNGYQYRVVVSGTCPPSANSAPAVLTVIPLPTITINPAGPVCGGLAGTSATQLTASGANTYTWAPLTGLYTNATGTTPYTGGNSATVYAAPTTNTVYTVSGTNTTTGCVGTATVTVNYTPPAPIVSPASATICLSPRTVVPLTITSSLAPSTVTGTSGTVNLAVPDFTPNGVNSTLNIAGIPVGAVISNISVTLNMTHTYPGDMIFNLKSPSSPKILNLYKYNGGNATGAAAVPSGGWYNAQVNNTSTTAFSAVGTPFAYGVTAPTGPFKPDALNTPVTPLGFPFDNPTGSVSDAAGFSDLYTPATPPNGVWTLSMADGGPADLGTLQSWSMSITYGVPSTGIWSPTTGLYTDAAGTIPYTGTPAQTVYASPTVSTTYSVTVANGTCTSPVRTVPVTVNNPATITTQPVNATVCTNKTTSFTVAATGTGITYQWQVSTDNGNTFTNITNGGVYSGATTNTLTISNPPVSMNGYLYRVNVISLAPCANATSLQRLLTVNPLPVVTITAVPTTRLMPGMTTTLTSTSAPAAAIYQWMRNGVQVGGNTPTHVVDIDALGTYMLHVIDVNGCENNSNSILISDSASGTVFIYPNPNPGSFQVRYYSTLNNSGLPRALNIYDDKGARVYRQNYTINAPYGRMDVDMRKFGSGTYWVEVVDAEGNRLAVGRAMILR